MSGIDYAEKIPNNVGLAGDRALQRALERWRPDFLSWWQDVGPEGAGGYDGAYGSMAVCGPVTAGVMLDMGRNGPEGGTSR